MQERERKAWEKTRQTGKCRRGGVTNRCEKVKSQVLQIHYESGKWGRETKIGGEVSEGRWRNNMR